MRMDIFIASFATFAMMVESSAWSLSNMYISGSKANDVYSESVLIAVDKGMEECRHQFRWEPWGCPKSSFKVFQRTHNKGLSKQPATREMAFLHAMVSSAIVVSITRNCSQGHFSSCGCDASKKGDMGFNGWSWGGCSDNVKIGNRMAKQYLDAHENGRDLRATINLHNNRVGRMMVKKSMRKLCKCHGVSGSCETKTCWVRLNDLREVGDRLREAYHAAQPFQNNGKLPPPPASAKRRRHHQQGATNDFPSSTQQLKLSKYRLVYTDQSPDYCNANQSAGIAGTLGRECSRRSGEGVDVRERSSCKNLCRKCGFRAQMRTVTLESTCRCKFYWCCNVKCKTCIDEVTRHVCVRR